MTHPTPLESFIWSAAGWLLTAAGLAVHILGRL